MIQDNCLASQGLFYVDSLDKDSVSTMSEQNAHKFRTIERANKVAETINNEWGKSRFKVVLFTKGGREIYKVNGASKTRNLITEHNRIQVYTFKELVNHKETLCSIST